MMFKEIIFFILPLLTAGICHHFLVIKYNLFSSLAFPVNQKLFGKSKTFRGFFVMAIISGFAMVLLSFFVDINLKLAPFFTGLIIGLGYSLGELPNSFIKRKLSISEGVTPKNYLGIFTYSIDQIDSILGAILAVFIVYKPSNQLIILLFFIGTILHIIIDYILYCVGYKKALSKPFQK